MTKRERAIAWAREHPQASFTDVARAVGCSVAVASAAVRSMESDEQIAVRRQTGRAERAQKATEDLAGKTYGKLTVLRRTSWETASQTKSGWLCRCTCGRECAYTATSLTSGAVKSCGRCPRDSEVGPGSVFGALTVLRRTDRRDKLGRRREYWVCRCECGGTKEVSTSDLRFGSVTSCGCGVEGARRTLASSGAVDGTKMSMLTARLSKANQSGVKGVFWDKRARAWHAKIKLRGKSYDLGTFKDLEAARAARKRAEQELFAPILEEHGRSLG